MNSNNDNVHKQIFWASSLTDEWILLKETRCGMMWEKNTFSRRLKFVTPAKQQHLESQLEKSQYDYSAQVLTKLFYLDVSCWTMVNPFDTMDVKKRYYVAYVVADASMNTALMALETCWVDQFLYLAATRTVQSLTNGSFKKIL